MVVFGIPILGEGVVWYHSNAQWCFPRLFIVTIYSILVSNHSTAVFLSNVSDIQINRDFFTLGQNLGRKWLTDVSQISV